MPSGGAQCTRRAAMSVMGSALRRHHLPRAAARACALRRPSPWHLAAARVPPSLPGWPHPFTSRSHRPAHRQVHSSSPAAAGPPLEEGNVFTSTRRFEAADVQSFADVSGDHNPIHLSDEFAATTPFGRPIVHGMLTASMFSTLFASNIPGSIYLRQE